MRVNIDHGLPQNVFVAYPLSEFNWIFIIYAIIRPRSLHDILMIDGCTCTRGRRGQKSSSSSLGAYTQILERAYIPNDSRTTIENFMFTC